MGFGKTMSTSGNILARFSLYFLVAICISFSFVGIGHVLLNVDTQGTPCPLMPGGASCASNSLQHLQAAQNFSNALPEVNPVFGILFALLLLTAFFDTFYKRIFFVESGEIANTFNSIRQQFLPQHNLQEAFSNGIIHSRAF